MTTGGWINLLLSVGFVVSLFGYCVYRVLRGPQAQADHKLAHIEPIEKDRAEE